jgi:alpha-1,2-glucosyltransferase
MEGIWAVRETLHIAELLKGLAVACALGTFLAPPSRKTSNSSKVSSPSLPEQLLQITGFLCLFVAARFWLALVDRYVPEPYLVSGSPVSTIMEHHTLTSQQDEVFHIPQAQTYCEGRFFDWDDKITTPPGL